MQTGPLLIGSLVGFFLNGVFAMQLYFYCMHFTSSDRRSFICLVAFVVIIELLHLVFSTHTLYGILVRGFGDPGVLRTSPFSGAAMPALNGLVGFCTQIFFAWRIIRLRQTLFGRIITGLVACTACLQCASAFGVSIQFAMLSRDIFLLRTLKKTVIIWLAGSFSCDTIISVAMATILYIERCSLVYTPSKRIVDGLIVHTVENGLVTTICALADLLAYLRAPDTFFYVCFEVLLGRLYAIVLLASLNGRYREERDSRGEMAFHCSFRSSASSEDLEALKQKSTSVSLSPLVAV
ncbi:hypothetical protein NMY22_g713 [Coprinellus aureogranulatus]|nr:hypothetical protein NMY22_g713 [Coprinellus aureogranulatus]